MSAGRTIAAIFLLLSGSAPFVRAEPCIGDGVTAPDAGKLVAEAIEVLRASGHDPSRYRVELRAEDPFRVATSGAQRRPALTAVFLPEDPGGYAVGVGTHEPCALTWLREPSGFTPWQRRAIERARDVARDSNPDGYGGEGTELRVIETREYLGFRLRLPGSSEQRTILLGKRDLAPVAR